MKPVTIDVQKSGSVCILDIKGEVRIGQPTVMLREKCKELIERGERRFVLDMLDVPWLDSSGIGEVVACFKRAREKGGTVKLVLSEKPYNSFTYCHLHRMFEMFDSLDVAMSSFRSDRSAGRPRAPKKSRKRGEAISSENPLP